MAKQKTPTINLIPAFTDNYFFCIAINGQALIVDPGSSKEVTNFLKKNDLKLNTILITHHHDDHIGGVADLLKSTDAQLYGPDLSSYGLKCHRILQDNSQFELAGINFKTIAVPGHTLDHLAYYSQDYDLLFCGDALFSLGCGRLFEGSFEQLYASLDKLRHLPDSTKVFCAHEYTLSNLKFSLSYLQSQGANEKLLHLYANLHQKIIYLRAQNEPTVPSTIGFEKQFNLFLKAKNLDELKHVREARNIFKSNSV